MATNVLPRFQKYPTTHHMKSIQQTLLAAGLLAASTASATINIDTVQVGNAGNANDGTGYGQVNYDYCIGENEVTNSQYTSFLNAVAATDTHSLYNTNMNSSTHGGINRAGTSGSYTYSVKSGFGDKPVNFVSFWDAARFANWLTNGQPNGLQGSATTEDGMYKLGGETNPINNTVTRQLDFATGENGVAVASEDEWYKAAFFNGKSDYNIYATQNLIITTSQVNYLNSIGTVTDVGTYAAYPSHYGTFDQSGNVWEVNDTIIGTNNRIYRGGSFTNSETNLMSTTRLSIDPTRGDDNAGFRVSSLAPIPEPSAYAPILGMLGLTLALTRRTGRA